MLEPLGLVIGLTGAIPVLDKIKKEFKRRFLDHDEFYLQLEKIALRVLKKHSIQNVNFSQKVEILRAIERGILSNELSDLNEQISSLLNISSTKLSQIISDFRSEMINSESTEIIATLSLGGYQNSYKILKNLEKVKNDIKELKRGNGLEETKEVILEYLKNLIEAGKLKIALYHIDRIALDRSNDGEYERNIRILETRVLLKSGLIDKFPLQLKKLIKIPEDNERNKLLYLLKMRLEDDKFNYREFLKEYKIVDTNSFLSAFHDIIESKRTELPYQYDSWENEQLLSVLRQILINCINTNQPHLAERIIKQHVEILNDPESRFYILLNRLNSFNKTHIDYELTISERKELQTSRAEFNSFESIFAEYNQSFRASFYYNYSILLCRMGDISWQNFFDFFKDQEEMVINFISFAERANFRKEILTMLSELNLAQKPKLYENYLDLKFKSGDIEDLSKINENTLNNIDLRCKIIIAKNLARHKELQENFQECDLILSCFESINLRVYIAIANIFKSEGDLKLARKYANLVYSKRKLLEEVDLYLLADMLFRLNLPRIAKLLCRESFDAFPQSKILYVEILKKITNNYQIPNLEIYSFFQGINTEESSPELIRMKIEYLTAREEFDKAIDFSNYLVKNYNNKLDWLNHSMILLRNGKFSEANKLVPSLEKIAAIETDIAIGLILLHTQPRVENKLESFGKYYFKVSKILAKDGYLIGDRLLQSAWFYVLSNHIYDSKEFDYVENDTHVILKSIDENSTIEICIHSDEELADNENPYLDCFHYYFKSSLIQSNLYLKRPIRYILDDNAISGLIGNGIEAPILKKLESMKDEEVIGKRKLLRKLESVLNFGDEHKMIPLIIEQLSKSYDEVLFNDKLYMIEDIFSIWNFPFRYISQKYYSNPDKYGLRLIDVNNDPAVSIIPELASGKEDVEQRRRDYIDGNLPFHVFSFRDYYKYPGAIISLIENKAYNAGVSWNLNLQGKAILSYTSLIFLFVFSKTDHIAIDKIIVANSTYDKISNISAEESESITQEKMSVFLDSDMRPSRVSFDKNINRKFAENWLNLKNLVEKAEIIDTTSMEDTLTLFTYFLGKLEIDSLRAAQMLKAPLIIDDEYFQKAVNYRPSTNCISYYFNYSNESLQEKLNFLNKLSLNGYKYIIYPGFIKLVFEEFLRIPIILGGGSSIDLFSKLLAQEFRKPYHHINMIREILLGFKLLIDNYLHQNSDILISRLFSVLPQALKKRIHLNLLIHLCNTSSQRKYVDSLLNSMQN